MRLLPVGDQALMLDCTDAAEARGWHAALAGAADVTLGARTLLVRGDPAEVRRLLASTSPGDAAARELHEVTVPVVYDGPDLAEVAGLTGLTADEVVAAHTAAVWDVAFTGFAPGFAYLTGGDPRLHVPRRGTPRSRVPAGAVALAGPYSGIYPRESPGGWQLLGRTDLPVWDLDRDPPALLQPGTRVRFTVARPGATP
ncbi:allophanate hydrolase subunit 1 [Aeromicrobium sp.]|uniref:5-oxoprolinase subunit B family protein n=1 Tax=Aeromicrobium sp. TaxID=1871063 RepID=UPI0025C3D43A|nr:allophanate hydrolase subunit 1 [Aeromicrobium sp.]MCK5891260.1 allophanate hydrolase subunit 1 [Aeromicrobium sp.]